MVTPQKTRRVAMFAFPDAQILDITGPLEVFSRTERWLSSEGHTRVPAYEIELLAQEAGPIRMSNGIEMIAQASYRDAQDIDTLLIAGGIGYREAMKDDGLIRWIREQDAKVQRLGSVCTGAMILAKTGLLRGMKATTHWAYCDELSKISDATEVEPDSIYVNNGHLYTSAGVTAGMDMALGMVEEDWGRPVALAVARQLVLFLKRPGGQSQFSAQLAAQASGTERFRDLQIWIVDNLEHDLSVPSLAERSAMSPRNFARAFVNEVGETPAKYVEACRIEAARRALEESRLPIEKIAYQGGFGTAESMRRAFIRRLNVPPAEYRKRFSVASHH